MTRVLSRNAPAKINLYLHVTGKREDGYHLLDSLVVFADDIADTVIIEESDAFSFSMSGLYSDGLADEDAERNLCVRAARLYCEANGIEPAFSLHLEKNLPAGAGIGGGSADAAATIHALEEFYGRAMPEPEKNLVTLGADVPVCYHASPCRFLGIGDVIRPIPKIPKLHMLLVWPNAHTATGAVFAARTWEYQRPVSFPPSYGNMQQFLFFLNSTKNDLSEPAMRINPVISQTQKEIEAQAGCRLARMSGSGSAVYGLFDTAEHCAVARENILSGRPDWWAQTTQIGV